MDYKYIIGAFFFVFAAWLITGEVLSEPGYNNHNHDGLFTFIEYTDVCDDNDC